MPSSCCRSASTTSRRALRRWQGNDVAAAWHRRILHSADDPAALSAWYRDCLGLDADENGLWRQQAGGTVFATFEADTDYLGSPTQQTMVNFRVPDLDAMLAQLRSKGADAAEETQDMAGVGRFGWITDPAGNRVKLWQPESP
jgi:predicted enzyme related to lactoylglutathione lyase